MAFCPNCDYEVLPDAPECGRCHAQFGGGSVWRPVETASTSIATTPRGAKALSWFALVSGVLTILTAAVLPFMSGQRIPLEAGVIFGVLGVATAASGYFGLLGKTWAFWLLFIVSVVQVAEYFSEAFFFSFIGPLSFKIGWGWQSPPSQLNINLVAVAVGAYALLIARRLTAASIGTRDEASCAGITER